MAALTRSGARKASEIVMLIFRKVQRSRPAMGARVPIAVRRIVLPQNRHDLLFGETRFIVRPDPECQNFVP